MGDKTVFRVALVALLTCSTTVLSAPFSADDFLQQKQTDLSTLFHSTKGGVIGPLFKHDMPHNWESAPDGGCFYQFQHYDEGDRIITNEPCLNCTCHNSMLMCYLKVCPFSKPIGQDCTIEKRPDQCCPVITCPQVPVNLQVMQMMTSTTTQEPLMSSTAIAPYTEHGCTIEGQYYPDGAQVPGVPDKPCELCYCIRNHTACVMQECILNVGGCDPVFEEGICCPVRYTCAYKEDEQGLITTTEGAEVNGSSIYPTTTMIPGPMGCMHNGEFYSDGASIPSENPCEHCYCMKSDLVCAVQECRSPLDEMSENCTPRVPAPGQCCPEAYDCPEPTEFPAVTDSSTLPGEVSTGAGSSITDFPSSESPEDSSTPIDEVTTIATEESVTEELGTDDGSDTGNVTTGVSYIDGKETTEPTEDVNTSHNSTGDGITTTHTYDGNVTPASVGGENVTGISADGGIETAEGTSTSGKPTSDDTTTEPTYGETVPGTETDKTPGITSAHDLTTDVTLDGISTPVSTTSKPTGIEITASEPSTDYPSETSSSGPGNAETSTDASLGMNSTISIDSQTVTQETTDLPLDGSTSDGSYEENTTTEEPVSEETSSSEPDFGETTTELPEVNMSTEGPMVGEPTTNMPITEETVTEDQTEGSENVTSSGGYLQGETSTGSSVESETSEPTEQLPEKTDVGEPSTQGYDESGPTTEKPFGGELPTELPTESSTDRYFVTESSETTSVSEQSTEQSTETDTAAKPSENVTSTIDGPLESETTDQPGESGVSSGSSGEIIVNETVTETSTNEPQKTETSTDEVSSTISILTETSTDGTEIEFETTSMSTPSDTDTSYETTQYADEKITESPLTTVTDDSDQNVTTSNTCSWGGIEYDDGSALPTLSKCQEKCECINGNVSCEFVSCPPAPPSFLRCTSVEEGECCPSITCPTPDPESPESPECIKDNISYSDGEYVPSLDLCTDCYCIEGEVICAFLECPAPAGQNCKPVERSPGQCCPSKYVCDTVDMPESGSLITDTDILVTPSTSYTAATVSPVDQGNDTYVTDQSTQAPDTMMTGSVSVMETRTTAPDDANILTTPMLSTTEQYEEVLPTDIPEETFYTESAKDTGSESGSTVDPETIISTPSDVVGVTTDDSTGVFEITETPNSIETQTTQKPVSDGNEVTDLDELTTVVSEVSAPDTSTDGTVEVTSKDYDTISTESTVTSSAGYTIDELITTTDEIDTEKPSTSPSMPSGSTDSTVTSSVSSDEYATADSTGTDGITTDNPITEVSASDTSTVGTVEVTSKDYDTISTESTVTSSAGYTIDELITTTDEIGTEKPSTSPSMPSGSTDSTVTSSVSSDEYTTADSTGTDGITTDNPITEVSAPDTSTVGTVEVTSKDYDTISTESTVTSSAGYTIDELITTTDEIGTEKPSTSPSMPSGSTDSTVTSSVSSDEYTTADSTGTDGITTDNPITEVSAPDTSTVGTVEVTSKDYDTISTESTVTSSAGYTIDELITTTDEIDTEKPSTSPSMPSGSTDSTVTSSVSSDEYTTADSTGTDGITTDNPITDGEYITDSQDIVNSTETTSATDSTVTEEIATEKPSTSSSMVSGSTESTETSSDGYTMGGSTEADATSTNEPTTDGEHVSDLPDIVIEPKPDSSIGTTSATNSTETNEIATDQPSTSTSMISGSTESTVTSGAGYTTAESTLTDGISTNELITTSTETTSDVSIGFPESIPGEGSCMFNKTTYSNGESIPTHSPCQESCTCQNSIISCSLKPCPSPPPAFLLCEAVEDTDHCCPTYNCPTIPASSGCTANDTEYRDGDFVPSSSLCTDCYCLAGEVICATLECPMPSGKNCKPSTIPDGGCCPESYECDFEDLDFTTPQTSTDIDYGTSTESVTNIPTIGDGDGITTDAGTVTTEDSKFPEVVDMTTGYSSVSGGTSTEQTLIVDQVATEVTAILFPSGTDSTTTVYPVETGTVTDEPSEGGNDSSTIYPTDDPYDIYGTTTEQAHATSKEQTSEFPVTENLGAEVGTTESTGTDYSATTSPESPTTIDAESLPTEFPEVVDTTETVDAESLPTEFPNKYPEINSQTTESSNVESHSTESDDVEDITTELSTTQKTPSSTESPINPEYTTEYIETTDEYKTPSSTESEEGASTGYSSGEDLLSTISPFIPEYSTEYIETTDEVSTEYSTTSAVETTESTVDITATSTYSPVTIYPADESTTDKVSTTQKTPSSTESPINPEYTTEYIETTDEYKTPSSTEIEESASTGYSYVEDLPSTISPTNPEYTTEYIETTGEDSTEYSTTSAVETTESTVDINATSTYSPVTIYPADKSTTDKVSTTQKTPSSTESPINPEYTTEYIETTDEYKTPSSTESEESASTGYPYVEDLPSTISPTNPEYTTEYIETTGEDSTEYSITSAVETTESTVDINATSTYSPVTIYPADKSTTDKVSTTQKTPSSTESPINPEYTTEYIETTDEYKTPSSTESEESASTGYPYVEDLPSTISPINPEYTTEYIETTGEDSTEYSTTSDGEPTESTVDITETSTYSPVTIYPTDESTSDKVSTTQKTPSSTESPINPEYTTEYIETTDEYKTPSSTESEESASTGYPYVEDLPSTISPINTEYTTEYIETTGEDSTEYSTTSDGEPTESTVDITETSTYSPVTIYPAYKNTSDIISTTQKTPSSTESVEIDSGFVLPEGCAISKTLYSDGANVPSSSPCKENCKCSNGTVLCQKTSCPPAPPAFLRCTTIPDEEDCCPSYDCSPSPDPESPNCSRDGEIYSDGEFVPSANECTDCYCLGGDIICALLECVSPGENCTPVSQSNTSCCPDKYECVETPDNFTISSTPTTVISSTMSSSAVEIDPDDSESTTVTVTSEVTSEAGGLDGITGSSLVTKPSTTVEGEGSDSSIITEASVATDGLDTTEGPSATISSLFTEGSEKPDIEIEQPQDISHDPEDMFSTEGTAAAESSTISSLQTVVPAGATDSGDQSSSTPFVTDATSYISGITDELSTDPTVAGYATEATVAVIEPELISGEPSDGEVVTISVSSTTSKYPEETTGTTDVTTEEGKESLTISVDGVTTESSKDDDTVSLPTSSSTTKYPEELTSSAETITAEVTEGGTIAGSTTESTVTTDSSEGEPILFPDTVTSTEYKPLITEETPKVNDSVVSSSSVAPVDTPTSTDEPFPPYPGSSSTESPKPDTTTWTPSTTTEFVLGPGACLFDGKVYVSAQQIPREDPCDFCFCFRGDIICLQQTCPPPIPGCYEEAIVGFCCPRYECPVTQAIVNITTTTTPIPTYPPVQTVQKVTMCEIGDRYYHAGEIVEEASGPCLECRCGYDGMMECDPKDCQAEPMLRKILGTKYKR